MDQLAMAMEEEEEELKRGGVRAPSSPSRKAAAELVPPPPPPPHHPKLLKKFLLSFCCCFMENKEEGGSGFIYFSNPNPNPNPDPNPGGADSMETLPPPRWKQILRRLKAERHRLNGSRRRRPLFLYDPLSYSMNFDDSCRWQQLDDMQSFRLSSTALTA